jgi:hypothetical protein
MFFHLKYLHGHMMTVNTDFPSARKVPKRIGWNAFAKKV